MREISISEISALVGKSQPTVSKYITKAGISPVRADGRQRFYNARDVLAFKLMESDVIRTETDYDLEAERARETKERADNLELKNAQLRRELIPVDLMSWTLGDLGSQISAILESIPVKLKRRMPKFGAAEVDIVKSEIAKCQNACADLKVNFDDYENQS